MATSVSILQDVSTDDKNFLVEDGVPKTRVLSSSEMLNLDKETPQHKRLDTKFSNDFSKWVEIVKQNKN